MILPFWMRTSIVSAILAPTGPPGQVLGAWRAERFSLVTAPAILDEIERVLKYPKIAARHGLPADRVQALVTELAYFSLVTPGRLRLDVVRDDPADNRYLEAAVEAEAGYIVSGDRLLLTLTSYEGVEILTPRQFLGVLSESPDD
jgi:putative PIN family toxin of toxin-antitoxin system